MFGVHKRSVDLSNNSSAILAMFDCKNRSGMLTNTDHYN